MPTPDPGAPPPRRDDDVGWVFREQPPRRQFPPLDGAGLITLERQRQIDEEGWTPEHDDTHTHGDLAGAAALYLQYHEAMPFAPPPPSWPWSDETWKLDADPIKNLVKAGALVAAEIDRLHREDH